MKVRLEAFECLVSPGISIENLIDSLKLEATVSKVFRSALRQTHIESFQDDLAAGAILSIKDQQNVLTFNNGKLNVEKLKGGLSNCNIFAMNTKTGRGIYAYYHHSFSLLQVAQYWRPIYTDLQNDMFQQDMSQARTNGGKATKKFTKATHSLYNKPLKIARLPKSSSLNQLLEDLDEINSFQFIYHDLIPTTGAFTSLSRVLKRETARISFDTEHGKRAIKKAITKAVKEANLETGIIRGKLDGKSKSVHLKQPAETFGEWEFDDVVSDLADIDFHKLEESRLIQELLEIVSSDDNKAKFQGPAS